MNRRKNNITKNLKDYIVPIIGLFLILLLIVSIFSGNEENNDIKKIEAENQIGYTLTLDTPTTESYIVYPGDYKKKIEESLMVYKGEKVIVKEGSVSMELDGIADLKLSKLGELKYADNGDLFLYSSDLWLNTQNKMEVNMRYASVSAGSNTTLSFSQNEMGSTVYLLSGFAEVTNLAGESTVLAPGQKLSISRLEANKEDIDLQLSKDSIDDYFKSTDWFIKNNGAFYLSKASIDEDVSSTGSIEAGNVRKIDSGIISFDSLVDESQVSSSSIHISGSYNDEKVEKIVLNGQVATLNKQNKTFKFIDVSTAQKENDLVFKAIDDAGDILEKFVYTVYYSAGSTGSESNQNSAFTVKNFAVDATKFQFTSPTTANIYTTSEDFITIRGKVSDDSIAVVKVNGYQLKSFNGSTWRYHASTANNNLKDGTNIYEIKYYNENNQLVYTNYFTINRKLATAIKPVVEVKQEPQIEEKKVQTYSNET